MDPITIMAGASAAFNAIKKGIEVGRGLQDMSGQLSQWAGAMSDLGRAETKAKNPPWWKSLSGGVEQEAMQIFAAKKKQKRCVRSLNNTYHLVWVHPLGKNFSELSLKYVKENKSKSIVGLS